jgi:O-antigen/teichoic acid export membrane protein
VIERLVSLGLPTLVVREVARVNSAAPSCHLSLVRIGLAGAAVATLGAATLAWVSPDRGLLAPALVISVGLFASAYALANEAVFLALGNAHYGTLVTSIESALRVIASLMAVLVFDQGVLCLVVIHTLARALGALLGTFLVRRRLGLTRPPHDPRLTASMLRSAPEFLVIFALPVLLFRLDVVMLGVLAGDYAVGIYAVAMRVVSVCLIVPDSLMTASFASLSRLSGQDAEPEFQSLVGRTVRWMALVLVPVTLGGLLLGPGLLQLLFGSAFGPAGGILQILVWALLPFALNRAMGDALVARGHQRALSRAIVWTLGASTLVYFMLIPAYGSTGAAWGLVSSVFLLFVLTAFQAVVRLRLTEPDGIAFVLAPVASAMVVFAVIGATNGGLTWTVGAAVVCLCCAPVAYAAARELQLMRTQRSQEAG